jgi:proteic killer suppression protein
LFLPAASAGIQAPPARKLWLQTQIDVMDLPGYRLHLRSIWVNGNWRLTFTFRDGHVFDVDFEDYH